MQFVSCLNPSAAPRTFALCHVFSAVAIADTFDFF